MTVANAESVFAVAWNPTAESTVASGGGDDKAFLFQVINWRVCLGYQAN